MEKMLILLVTVALMGICQGTHMFRDLPNEFQRRQRSEMGSEDCSQSDIVFVLDESGSIYSTHFTDQLNFVNLVVGTFDVGPNKTRIGVETFSDDERTIFDLDTYTDVADITKAVSGIKQLRGGTYTYKALANMRENMFSLAHAREAVQHIAIVITDGESHEPERTIEEAARAHEAGITVFAIGVGHSIIDEELQIIASKPEYVFKVDSYDLLAEILSVLTYKACQVPPLMVTDCLATNQLDLMLSLPEHAGVTGTRNSVMFLKKLVGEFNIGSVQTQVGLTPRICGEDEGIYLDEHDTKEALKRDLNGRKVLTSHMKESFDYLNDEGFVTGARDAARKATVLLVDAPFDDFQGALESAQRLQQNALVILVGVGDAVNKRQLLRISSEGGNFHVNTYEELNESLVGEIIDRVCQMLLLPAGGFEHGPEK